MDLAKVVAASFSEPQKCYGHCEAMANLKYLRSGDVLIACYVCPAGYVSRVMAYGSSSTLEQLRAFLTEALGDEVRLGDEDLRVATRHIWDLRTSGGDVSASYWTQNYRKAKSDDPNRKALFSCSRCGALYLRPISASGTLCPRCAG
jgi:hypothetical protein